MSYKYFITNEFRKGWNITSIKCIKVVSTLHKLNGITDHSYRYCLMFKVVFHMSFFYSCIVLSQFKIQLGDVVDMMQQF